MNELIDKISSYNFFNYLFPGILFSYFSQEFTSYTFIQDDLVIGFFVYYFIGLIVSRFGSIIIEPIFKKIKIIKHDDYKKFVFASKKDPKIELFSEINNMYRTICSLMFLIIFAKIYEIIEIRFPSLKQITPYLILIFLFILFIFSYKKQSKYIVKRIKINEK